MLDTRRDSINEGRYLWSDPATVFCEHRRGGNQPSNVVSSLFLSGVGLHLLLRQERQKDEEGRRHSHNGRATAYLLLLVSACTALMHSYPKSRRAAALDGISMYMLLTHLTLKNVGHGDSGWYDGTRDALVASACVFLACVSVPSLLHMRMCALLTGAWVLSTLPSAIRDVPNRKSVGLLVFLVAYVCWRMDRAKTVCRPSSPLQLHAAWHILSAFGFLLTEG